MLTKHTHIGLALVVAIAFPGAAIASGATQRSAPEFGRGGRAPVSIEVLQRPLIRFQLAIRTEVGRLAAERRVELRAQTRRNFTPELPAGVSLTALRAIAACESGGNPRAISPGGTYRGLYQFDAGTWASVGGSGDPASASPAQQTYRAALLYSRSGSSPWPVCG